MFSDPNSTLLSFFTRTLSPVVSQVVDTAQMTFYDQLKLVRGSNIIIGVHGAGLMFIMFAAEEVRKKRELLMMDVGWRLQVIGKVVENEIIESKK
jgi:capsular polysaccharide biosynthesis protein